MIPQLLSAPSTRPPCGSDPLAALGYYAEAHHIRPLGRDRPDTRKASVRPDHHVGLGNGMRKLHICDFRAADAHLVSPIHLDF